MLAEERPATPMPDRGAFEAQRRAEPADGAEARVRQIHEELAGDEMRVAEHVAVIGDLAARHPRRSQGGEPVRSRFCSGDRLDRGDERIAVVPAQRRVRVARIALETLEAKHAAEGGPVRRRRRADDEVPVGGGDRLVWCDELVRRSRGARDLAGGEVHTRLPNRERNRRLEHRDVNELALSVAVPCAQGTEGGDRRVERGGKIGDRHADFHGRPALLAGHAHEPTLRLDDDVERRPIGVRSVQAPSGHGHVHQTRIAVQKISRGETQVVHRARAQVLDDHVGGPDEEREQLSSGLALEIDRDRALVAVEPSEVRALAVRDGLEHSGEISAARALHLDHIGPEIGELHPAERPGHVVPDLDDAYPAEGRVR